MRDKKRSWSILNLDGKSEMLPRGDDSSQALQMETRRRNVSGYVLNKCKGPVERGHEAYLKMEVKRTQCLRH